MDLKEKKAFTLIESMVVLFIIGLLAAIGAIGFGKVNRAKMLQLASSRIGFGVGQARNYSIYGKDIGSNVYPCGYGIYIKKGDSNFKIVYTNALNRVDAMNQDKTCNELIDNKNVTLGELTVDDSSDLSLGNVSVDYLNGIVPPEDDCAVILFSAPRGGAYYCSGKGSGECPSSPSECVFKVFNDGNDSTPNKVDTKLKISEGINTDSASLEIYSSGNTELIQE